MTSIHHHTSPPKRFKTVVRFSLQSDLTWLPLTRFKRIIFLAARRKFVAPCCFFVEIVCNFVGQRILLILHKIKYHKPATNKYDLKTYVSLYLTNF